MHPSSDYMQGYIDALKDTPIDPLQAGWAQLSKGCFIDKEIDIEEEEHDFIDISDEFERTYIFSDTQSVTINYPMKLVLTENEDCVIDQDETSYVIPKGWIALRIDYMEEDEDNEYNGT